MNPGATKSPPAFNRVCCPPGILPGGSIAAIRPFSINTSASSVALPPTSFPPLISIDLAPRKFELRLTLDLLMLATGLPGELQLHCEPARGQGSVLRLPRCWSAPCLEPWDRDASPTHSQELAPGARKLADTCRRTRPQKAVSRRAVLSERAAS